MATECGIPFGESDAPVRSSDGSSSAAEYRGLVRRFRFLGLPGEKEAGALSYARLREQLGDAGAEHLVMHLVAMVRAQATGNPTEPLHERVGRLLQSLSPEQRCAIIAAAAQ
jgi:hypothetical protein